MDPSAACEVSNNPGYLRLDPVSFYVNSSSAREENVYLSCAALA